MSHHVHFHDTQLADDFVTFEAFCAGTSPATTEIHQMLQEAANTDNSTDPEEPPDSLHAHVTKCRQNMGPQNNKVNATTTSKPPPGNINHLLDRTQAHK